MVVKFEARRARLRHLNQGVAPAEDIADKYVSLSQPFGGEVLAKGGGDKEVCLLGKFGFPVLIVLARIVAKRAFGSAVDLLFGLLVTRQANLG